MGVAGQTLVAVLSRLTFKAIPGGSFAFLGMIPPVCIVCMAWRYRIDEMLEGDLRPLFGDSFGIWVRAILAVQLPRSQILFLPMVVGPVGIRTLGVVHLGVVLGLPSMEHVVLILSVLIGVREATQAIRMLFRSFVGSLSRVEHPHPGRPDLPRHE